MADLQLPVTGVPVYLGENTALAVTKAAQASAAATTAEQARDAALALANFFPGGQAAGEAGTSAGELFSYLDGNDELVLAVRTGGGSTVLDIYFGASHVGTATGDTVQKSLDAYSTRTAIKALTAAAGRRVYLSEAGREGIFVFKSGNYSSRITADTQEGIYLEASNVAASAGAWVRWLPYYSGWMVDWFGVPDDPAAGLGGGSEVQCHNEMTAMMNVAAIDKPATIFFASKVYALGDEIPAFTWQVVLEGMRGAKMTVIAKRYVEADDYRGVLAFGNYAAVLRNINIVGTSGSGGSLVSAILTTNAPQQGLLVLEHCILSAHLYANYSLYINGLSNVEASGPGYRGVDIVGGQIFGAMDAAIKFEGVQHAYMAGGYASYLSDPGTSAVVLDVSGNEDCPCDDIQFHGIVDGDVNLSYTARCVITSPRNGTVTLDANCTACMWVGSLVAGGVTNASPPGEFQHAGIWDAYTPTLTAGVGTFTSATATGRYTVLGKTVHFRVEVNIPNAGSADGNIEVTLPMPALNSAAVAGIETNGTGAGCRGIINAATSTTKCFIRKYDNTTIIASGRFVVVSGTYEAA